VDGVPRRNADIVCNCVDVVVRVALYYVDAYAKAEDFVLADSIVECGGSN
jgi:hypothetical protein